MIKFNTRHVGEYINLIVKIDNVTHDLGLQDQTEITELINDLKEAIDDFDRFLEL